MIWIVRQGVSVLGKADLHIHSTASDGSCQPVQLVQYAKDRKLATIAITDHDTVDGYLKARSAAEKSGINLLPGVELTLLADGVPIHVLAYEFEAESDPVTQLMKRQRFARIRRMKRMLDVLESKHAISVTMDEVRAQARSASPGRPHLAQVLVRKKIVGSISEAFIRYLARPEIRTIGAEFATIDEAIKIIREAGGVTSLAHPGPIFSMNEVRRLVGFGLDGIECIHPSHDFSKQKRYLAFAEEEKLLVTGGSDYHGDGEGYAPWFGLLTLNEKRVASIRRLSENRKRLNIDYSEK